MSSLLESRLDAWLPTAFFAVGEELKTRSGIDEETLKNVGLGALALGSVYALYKACAWNGKTEPLQLPEMVEIRLTYKDPENLKDLVLPFEPGMKLEGDILKNIATVSKEVISELKVLERQIASLSTREEMIAWIIKYQHLTMPIANGKDVVNGTTACGLVTALRMAAACENMKILDKSAFVALKETLESLRDSQSLELLNKTKFTDHSELQKIEAGLHKKHMAEYDTIGKLLSSVDPRARSVGAFGLSNMPTEISASTLGASKAISNGIDYVTEKGKEFNDSMFFIYG